MGFNAGIIGLPNVGKTTIFNALSNTKAEMANYPFCTIEPNRSIVTVPDERLNKISDILKKENPIPTKIEFVDIAGLVKGASKGEGLGNKFLSHIRNVNSIIHIVRCFENSNVAHVEGRIDPIRDIELVNTELILSDIELLENAKIKLERKAKSGNKEIKKRLELVCEVIKILNNLDNGKALFDEKLKEKGFGDDDFVLLKEYGLISLKPVLYLANVGENGLSNTYSDEVKRYAESTGAQFLSISGKIEEEISELPPDEKTEFLNAMGLSESGLTRLIKSSYKLLDLITFYTTATQLQAWTIKNGSKALTAASKIHTDFSKGFIKAEVYNYKDLIEAGSEHALRESGKLKFEGKDYAVKDGDIIKFHFNV